ncbi:Eco57I restriction-modification methylase domain-containing protein [Nocardia beijingensis]|uniref:Eco57I restriction-modification methylase domain-containing protein n=1 Tax=Nocardia beijingensis TaxID=95162 RepID=UPI001E512BE7|nr:N-6 DNA methylase [Nocardia beijingensis]
MASEALAARDRKRHGRHYTPPVLARFLAQRLLRHVEPSDAGVLRVLDPACGDGELLFAVHREAATRFPGVRLVLIGYDLDARALAVARERARAAGIAAHWRKADFLAVEARLPDGSFDAVITNPPYVRTQQLGGSTARLLSKRFGLRGRIDLTHPFVATLPRLLTAGGVLGLLCANRFLTTKAGANIRRLLLTDLSPVELYDLGDTKLFTAAVLPAITIARRCAHDDGCRYVSAYEVGDAEPGAATLFEALVGQDGSIVTYNGRTFVVEVGTLVTECGPVAASGGRDRGDSAIGTATRDGPPALTAERAARRGGTREPEAAWRMSHDAIDAWLARIATATWRSFGDLARIRVGIKTTADRVFISDRWAHTDPCPEPELLLDLITHHDLAPWRATRARDVRVLYPYDLASSRRTPIDLDDYPGAAAYLRSHHETLAGRRYVAESGRAWYEIWVPQRPHLWREPKLVFPDISDRPRFALDSSGAVVNGDCYWISLLDLAGAPAEATRLAYLLMGVANSALGLRFYDVVCGNRLYSGRRRWITQYVSRLPVPDPAAARSGDVIDLVREFAEGRTPDAAARAELDERVAAAFGIGLRADPDADHRQQGAAGELPRGVPIADRDQAVGRQGQRQRQPGHDLGDQIGVEVVRATGIP